MKYKCICCSTENKPVFVTPLKRKDGYLHCPLCNSIELEEVSEGKK